MDNLIRTKYGNVTKEQVANYIEEIRHMVFWCIIYTDPKTSGEYQTVDVVSYHKSIMKKLDGFNSLLMYPNVMVAIMSIMESALKVLESDTYTFKEYRSLILDAGAMAKKLQFSHNELKVGDA